MADVALDLRHSLAPRWLRMWLVLGLLATLPLALRQTGAADGDAAPELAPLEITAPRVSEAPPSPSAAPVPEVFAQRPAPGRPGTTPTATRTPTPTFDAPSSITQVDREDILHKRAPRSMAHAMQGVPGVLVQKTAPLQFSPFIRGFTAYHNVLLVDGVRLNHSAMRSGPNQYWATIDPYTIDTLDVVRGPHSVLYGSDAVGGTVNARTWRRRCCNKGWNVGGRLLGRWASAEDAYFGRIEVEGNAGDLAWAGGVSYKSYGDITSGGGKLPGTGGIEELDVDWRFDRRLAGGWLATVAYQRVRQDDAPRTERTVDAVPFAGTSVGSELQRDYNQERDLIYARLSYDACNDCAPLRRGHLTLSYHRHGEERDRLRTRDRRDLSGFELDQLGIDWQMESRTAWGALIYGASWYHDTVDSFRREYQAGALTRTHLQGPLGDDGTYDLAGAFLQHRFDMDALQVYAGVRFTYAAAEASRVDDPTDPSVEDTPGNLVRVENDWTSVVGSVRAVFAASDEVRLFGGVSQGFRAPSLYDLTSFDATSVVETPAPDLDAEKYLSFELGIKQSTEQLRVGLSGWATLLDDAIIRSPTGTLIGGTPEVRKDNIGDGHVWGIDFEAAWSLNPCWTLLATASYMDGEVDQLDATGALVRAPLSRMKPLSTYLGLRYSPPHGRFWLQGSWEHVEGEDRLSFRDMTDSRRIPPGGTPGYDVFHVRAGMKLGKRHSLSIGLENLTDENYRVHGSGFNEPGFQAVLAFELGF